MADIPRFPAGSLRSGQPITTNVRKPHCWFDPSMKGWVCGNYCGRSWASSPVEAVSNFHNAFKWRWSWRRQRWVCLPKNRWAPQRGVMFYAVRTQPKARKYRRG